MEVLGFVGNLSPTKKITVAELADELSPLLPGGGLAADLAGLTSPLDEDAVDVLDAALGGGASPIIESDWVTFTDAEIKAWPTVPSARRQIVAAPGAGKYLRFFGADMILDTTAGPYGGVGAAAVIRFLAGGTLASTEAVEPTTTNMFEEEGVVRLSVPVRNPPATGSFPISEVENEPLYLVWNNDSAAAFTGGNAANTLKVKLWYSEVVFS